MDTIDGPVVMWGSCFGGPIAIRYAAEHPDRISRLILDGTFAFGATLAADHRRDSFLSLLRLAPSQPDAVFASLSYLTDPEPGITHEARVRRLRASIEPELLEPLYSLIYEADVRDEASALTMPTLVVHRFGSRSVSVSAGRALASRIADVRFVTLQGRAQNLWEEDSESALAVVGEFLGLDLGPEPAVVEPVVQIEPQAAPRPRGGLGAVLFTDMEASTATTTRLGDVAAHALVRAHNRIVREALAARGASEIKHTGDGIMAWTPSISGALSAATAIQHAIGVHATQQPGQAIGLKIGISAGEPLTENDDLFGSIVQLARRACDAGGPVTCW